MMIALVQWSGIFEADFEQTIFRDQRSVVGWIGFYFGALERWRRR